MFFRLFVHFSRASVPRSRAGGKQVPNDFPRLSSMLTPNACIDMCYGEKPTTEKKNCF